MGTYVIVVMVALVVEVIANVRIVNTQNQKKKSLWILIPTLVLLYISMAGLDMLISFVDRITGGGKNDTFKEDLAMSESSNKYDVVNDKGYMGKYQFGDARLEDFKNANKDYKFTKKEFLNDPSLQEDVFSWHVEDINNYIDSRGLDKYIGTEINGVTITRDGLIAGAHLGGKTGLKNFLSTGKDKEDSYGTSISEYITKFSS